MRECENEFAIFSLYSRMTTTLMQRISGLTTKKE